MTRKDVTWRVFLPAALAWLLLVAGGGGACAQDAQWLFDRGKSALAQPNYLAAAEYLYAYLQIDHELLDQHPGFRQAVEDHLDYAEAQIRAAILAKEQLDQYGSVVGVEVESGGKFDAPGAPRQKVSKPFHLPAAPPRPQQPLGNRPRRTVTAAPGAVVEASKTIALAGPSRTIAFPGAQPLAPVARDAQNRELELLREKFAQLQQEHATLQKRYVLMEDSCRQLGQEYRKTRERFENR